MKETLEILFDKSIEFCDENYTEEQIKTKWIGNLPASGTEIENAEKRLGIKLPQDYIEMVSTANGFPPCSNSVEPSFQKVDEIDFYRNFQWNVIDTWKEMEELNDVVSDLERAIMIAGLEDEQQFLIVPPTNGQNKWKYWKFAMWIPGEEEYQDLKSYLEGVIEFLNEQIQENKK
ncbi:SMI1/KNR4 family protein [Mangrovibacterium diazotrophicum]|uniref:SUKH superfamily protein n=1 Tax=Mangrovibacterium diazotrophicum TaxID=1261403 RepID=A0A419WBN1_9BACT|nr:SMI1/KNR4 family protein [Mangrovibacterium diazotrophicum]RKD92868.1 SUKH superfamily protein [Mangrovibacterium diazotrophicum]